MEAPSRREPDRGQSSPLGVVLLLAIVIVGISVVVTFGAVALTDTQGRAELERAENSMTLFDSRAAMVALGESDGQSINFGQDSGGFEVNEDAGWIRITHTNYSNDSTVRREVIFNRSLGSVVYENGDRRMAYQGGGVWLVGGEGEARMISPPEFHYRAATLTLPIIRVRGTGSAGGSARISVEPVEQARTVFPNTTAAADGVNEVGAPYNDTERPYTNPIRNGTVNVTVHSEYYEAWAEYFRTRTTGEVTVFDSNDTVRLQLQALGGPPGAFTVPDAGDSIEASGIDTEGHPIQDFELSLEADKNKPHFSFYATEDDQELELHVHVDGNPTNDCPGSEPTENVHLSTYYYNGSGDRAYETWETASTVDVGTTSALDWRCDGGDAMLDVDFNSEDLDLTYDEVGSRGDFDPGIDDPSCGTSTGVTRGNKYAFHDRMEDCDGEGWELADTSTWDQHDPAVSWEGPSETYDEGTGATQTLSNVTNHYLSLMGPEVNLISKDGPGNSDSINEPGSSGELDYETAAGARFITFLHVTENEIDVDFD